MVSRFSDSELAELNIPKWRYQKLDKATIQEQRNAEMRRLRGEGWTFRQLAEKFHMSRQGIHKICGDSHD